MLWKSFGNYGCAGNTQVASNTANVTFLKTPSNHLLLFHPYDKKWEDPRSDRRLVSDVVPLNKPQQLLDCRVGINCQPDICSATILMAYQLEWFTAKVMHAWRLWRMRERPHFGEATYVWEVAGKFRPHVPSETASNHNGNPFRQTVYSAK